MAQVPVQSTPSVAPSSAPTPDIRVQPPAEAFGTTVAGQTLSGLDQASQQTADALQQHALAFQALDNKAAADNATIDYAAQANQLDAAYREANRNSTDAVSNLPNLYKQLDQLHQNILTNGNLSPLAAAEYEAASRRTRLAVESSVVPWSADQRVTAIKTSAHATVGVAASAAAADPDNLAAQNNFAVALGQSAAQLRQIGDLQTDDEVRQYMQQTGGSVYEGQIKNAADAGDTDKARSILDAHKSDMTEQQLTQSLGVLKVGAISSQANADAMAWLNRMPTKDTVPSVPQGSWDKGVAQFRADPAGAISQLVGGPVTITSGARTAAGNATVGGSPTSEHLTGNAWDYVPQSGNLTTSATTLASGLHAAGIPFDQIEVDPTNGHVHVGFGPKNRNEIIDQNGNALPQAREASTASRVPPTPPITSQTDPEAYLAQADLAVSSWVAQRYPNNPNQQAASLNAIHSRIGLQVQALKAQQDSNYTQASSMVLNNNLQDLSSVPASLIAAMPPRDVLSLQAATRRNASELTPARQDNIVSLKGMADQNPQQFTALDLKQVDLPTTTRLTLMKQQQDMIAKGQKSVHENTIVSQALNSIEGKAALNSLGITDKSSPEYNQFAGALASSVEALGDKPPSQKDMNLIISQVSAKVGAKPGMWGIQMLGGSAGTNAFAVPQTEHDAIVKAFPNRNLTERDISQIYHNRLRR